MMLDLVELAHLCAYVLEYIPRAFERVAFYSPEQLEFDQFVDNFCFSLQRIDSQLVLVS